MRRSALLAAVVAALTCAFAAASASASIVTRTSAEKQTAMIDAMEDFVARAEKFYCDPADRNPRTHANCSDGDAAPGWDIDDSTGTNDLIPFYAAYGPGVEQARGDSGIAYVLATMLEGSAASTFTIPDGTITRSQVEDRIENAIRHVAYSNDLYDPNSGDDGNADMWWGGEECFETHCSGPIIAYQLGWAGLIAWNSLSSNTRRALEDVVASEANVMLAQGPGSKVGSHNSFGEENGWGASLLGLAAVMFPGRGEAGDWHDGAQWFAINASSIAADASDTRTTIDGTTLADWYVGGTANLEDDFTLTNHSIFHPIYSWSVFSNTSEAAMYYEFGGLTPPPGLLFRAGTVWDEVLGPLSWDDGDIVPVAGTDWTTHDYGHVGWWAFESAYNQRDDASVLEWRALEQFIERQEVTMDAFDNLGYQSDMYRALAQAWWVHEEFGPAPTPTEREFDDARALTDGVHVYANQDAVVGRFGEAFLSMSWRRSTGTANTSPTALIIPSNEDFLTDPVLMQQGATTGVDSTSAAARAYSCDCDRDDYFSTAGWIDQSTDRWFSMTGFDDGIALLLDRGSGGTFSFGFEDLDGFVPERTVQSESGTSIGDLRGEWANVDDRFAIIAKGGGGLFASHETNAASPYLWLRGSKSTGTGERVAMVMPNVTDTVTDALEPDFVKLTSSQSDWLAVSAVAPDGTGKFAVARYGGSGTSTISGLSTRSLGVPIPDLPNAVTVTGSSGSTSLSLSNPESVGSRNYWYATAESGKTVTITPLSETRLKLVNGGSSNSVTVRYDAGAGASQTDTRTLAAGETAIATLYNGQPEIIVPSASTTEPPGTYAPFLTLDGDTTGASNFWVSDAATLSRTPECLLIDFGTNKSIGRVTMIPRRGYGPKDYRIESAASGTTATCGTTTGWSTRATVTNSGDGTPKSHSWGPSTDRYVRIKITAAYGSGPPHYVQIREFTPAPS